MKAAATAVLLLVAVPGQIAPVPVAGLPGATLAQADGRLVLHLPGGARAALSHDGPCTPCALFEARRVAGGQPGALAMVSGHVSRPGAPMAMCGAGEESVLHLLVRAPRWHEVAALRLDSCWQTIEAVEPPRWDGQLLIARRFTVMPDATLRHAWRVGPNLDVTALRPAP